MGTFGNLAWKQNSILFKDLFSPTTPKRTPKTPDNKLSRRKLSMIIEYLIEMTKKQVRIKIVIISLLLLISSFVFAFDHTSFANGTNETSKVSQQNKVV